MDPQYNRLFCLGLSFTDRQARGFGGGGRAAERVLAGKRAAACAPHARAAVELQAGAVRKGRRAAGIDRQVVVESQSVVVVAVELVQVRSSLRSAPTT